MKKILIHSLLRRYSCLTISIIVLFASIVAYTNSQNYLRDVRQTERQVSEQIAEELNYYYRQVKNDVYSYSRNKHKLDGISQYFRLSPSDYLLWLIRHPLAQEVNVSLHSNISKLYLNNDFIQSIDVVVEGEKEVFTSTRQFKGGYRILAKDYRSPKHSLYFPMFDPHTSERFATVFVSIDVSRLETLIEEATSIPLSVIVTDGLNRDFFTLQKNAEAAYVHAWAAGDLKVSVGTPKSFLAFELAKWTVFIFASSGVLIMILLWVLKRNFYDYQAQLTDLVTTMRLITEQDNQMRIDLSSKKEELYLISHQMNDMLDSLEKNITDIYKLQLAQKDANMRALQAQINPHFLYNTLEFFRMYAVTREQDELADMIYEFSTLLRGSITQEKVTTIQEELQFCEKHSFICQIRYPKSIAYAYQIDKGCENLVLPRFSIQPLVENYFIHGIDFSKRNNALSVKVLRKGPHVEILIRDNGKGMSDTTLTAYRHMLEQRQIQDIKESKSIGITNVHERFLLHFGEAYAISLYPTEGGGVTYRITLQDVLDEEE